MRPAAFPDHLKPVAPGTLHSPFVCAFCGATSDLRRTILGLTRAEAAVCVDPVECVRKCVRRQLGSREVA